MIILKEWSKTKVRCDNTWHTDLLYISSPQHTSPTTVLFLATLLLLRAMLIIDPSLMLDAFLVVMEAAFLMVMDSVGLGCFFLFFAAFLLVTALEIIYFANLVVVFSDGFGLGATFSAAAPILLAAAPWCVWHGGVIKTEVWVGGTRIQWIINDDEGGMMLCGCLGDEYLHHDQWAMFDKMHRRWLHICIKKLLSELWLLSCTTCFKISKVYN